MKRGKRKSEKAREKRISSDMLYALLITNPFNYAYPIPYTHSMQIPYFVQLFFPEQFPTLLATKQ